MIEGSQSMVSQMNHPLQKVRVSFETLIEQIKPIRC